MSTRLDVAHPRTPPGPSSVRHPTDRDAAPHEPDPAALALLDLQRADGHWLGELEGDTILESEYILLMAYLGREAGEVCAKACKYLHSRQGDDGGWSAYPGGPSELSTTVKAYYALKLCGMHIEHPSMVAARRLILDRGGAQGCNSFTRFYLALLGQIGYDLVPSVPPELLLLPKRTGFGVYAMSSWTRTIIVPLMVISACKPVAKTKLSIEELFRDDLPMSPSRASKSPLSWGNFFLGVDRLLKWADRRLPTSWRKPGLRAAHRWMVDHFEGSDGLGAIFPPMIYTVVALKCLGYSENSAPVRWALDQLDDLLIEEDGAIRVQPCISPVWDTAIATIALADAGLPTFHPSLMKAGRWLLDREVRVKGDWSVRRPHVEPGGWYFQDRNEHYPDIDDTAMVVMALNRTALRGNPEVNLATTRAVAWILAMQNRDGGWAAFDVDIDNEILTKVPFADHNAMLDPSCADITMRVVEMLAGLGYPHDHPAVERALKYTFAAQEPEGCWFGRWGVNYIYGTWQVLIGLKAIGHDMADPRVRRAVAWLKSAQQPCGGWGESCRTYDDPSTKGQGVVTASQTAWAVMGLVAAGEARSVAALRGVEHLESTRNAGGAWTDDAYTGTGFPKVFYLKYHLYAHYFPLMALARYEHAAPRRASAGALALARVLADPRPPEA